MASNPDFVQYIIDQCSGAGEIAVKKMMGDVMRSPYPGAKEHFYIDDVDDRDFLTAIIRATVPALPKPKSKNPMLKKEKYVPASLDDAIPQNLVCSQELRAFFEQHLGRNFRYKVGFQRWLRENAGKTYRDALEAYKSC